LEQLNIHFAQAGEVMPKINALKQYYVRKQELLPCVNCNVAVMWPILPSSSSPFFEVSTIFLLSEIGDIFVYGITL